MAFILQKLCLVLFFCFPFHIITNTIADISGYNLKYQVMIYPRLSMNHKNFHHPKIRGEYMKKTCFLCGNIYYHNIPFKSGYVCEECIRYLKSQNK